MPLDYDMEGRAWQVNPSAADPPSCSLLKGTLQSPQLPAAALLGQERLKPHSEVKPLGAEIPAVPVPAFPAPDQAPIPQTARPVLKRVIVPEPGTLLGKEDRPSALPALGGQANSMAGHRALSLFGSV